MENMGKSDVMFTEHDCALLRYRWVYFEPIGERGKNCIFWPNCYKWRYPKTRYKCILFGALKL